jgi:hypothetical protein
MHMGQSESGAHPTATRITFRHVINHWLPFVFSVVFVVTLLAFSRPALEDGILDLLRHAFGHNAVLDRSGPAPVCVKEECVEEIEVAAKEHDDVWMQALQRVNEIFFVAGGGRVAVIDRTLSRTKIRILEGDHAGKVGFVPIACLKFVPQTINQPAGEKRPLTYEEVKKKYDIK